MKKYTFEDFVNELEIHLKAKLPLKIQEMNADRPDFENAVPEPEAYYFQELTNEVPYSPFVWYGETGTDTVPWGPESKSKYTLQIAVMMANPNEAQGIATKRLLRYRECLKAVLEEAWGRLGRGITRTELTGISPFPFSTNNQYQTHIGIGVTLDIEIA